jgi:hypothetical protein
MRSVREVLEFLIAVCWLHLASCLPGISSFRGVILLLIYNTRVLFLKEPPIHYQSVGANPR